ncbi:MAG: hypothetical protein U9N49_12405 [Campylobacterota bacterium]|nr:hypothetical protein [Campylobacterota bacterium]
MKPQLLKYLLLAQLNLIVLWGGVNSFVIFNQNQINYQEAFIPLPSEQIIQTYKNNNCSYGLTAQKPLWVTLEGSQRLVITLPKEEKYQGDIKAFISLDGRLYKDKILKQKISSNGINYYDYTNPHNKIVAIKLTSQEALKYTIMTTYNISALRKIKPRMVDLNGTKSMVMIHSQSKTRRYDRFTKPQSISFEIEGNGTLELEMLTPLKTHNLLPLRERITLYHNAQQEVLESLEQLSPNYIVEDNESNISHNPIDQESCTIKLSDESNTTHTKLTYATKHYIPLIKGKNRITIQTHSDILLKANIYQKRLFNELNEKQLNWKIPHSLSYINQPIWKNSVSKDGLNRMYQILKQKRAIHDRLEDNSLINAAQKGTSFQTLFPYQIPLESHYSYGYYGIYNLYGAKELRRLATIHSPDYLAYLNHFKEGVFIDIPHTNDSLQYRLREPLKADTPLELTLQHEANSSCEIYIQSNIKTQKLTCHYQTNLEAIRFSKAFWAKKSTTKHYNNTKRLTLLNNSSQMPIINHSSTIEVILPKGTKHFSIYRSNNTPVMKVATRIREESIYRDTPYALANNYAGTYQRFAKSLYQHPPKSFDPWYEQTNPLRLWILSRIDKAKENIIPLSGVDQSRMLYARYLLEKGDRYTAMQVAKHILFLSKSPKLKKEAYHLLLELSQDRSQELRWHAAYFWQNQSPIIVQKIAQELHKEGQYSLAFIAHLLVDKALQDQKSITHLSTMQNYLEFSHFFEPSYQKLIQTKERILHSNNFFYNRSKKDIKINKSTGKVEIYSKSRDLYMKYNRVTQKQPLHLEVVGPKILTFDIRFLDTPDSYKWLSIEHNKSSYHYALTQLKPSNSLISKPDNKALSVSNRVILTLPKGKHILVLHGYNQALAIDVSGQNPRKHHYTPLEKQILKTSDNTPKLLSQSNNSTTPTTPYLSALLWQDEQADEVERYQLRAQAWQIAQQSHTSQYHASILRLLNHQSHFPSYPSLESIYGFYDRVMTPWNPSSTFQQNRTPLLPNIDRYDRVLTGIDYHTIHLQGEQNLSIDATQIFPEYIPTEKLCFGMIVDEEEETQLCFEANQTKWIYSFDFYQGEHTVKIRLINPLSTHYLGLNFLVDDHPIEAQSTQRFYETRDDNPIVIYDMGPMLLRIEELQEDDSLKTNYIYLPEFIDYHQKILPSKDMQKSLVRISKMEVDLTITALRSYEHIETTELKQSNTIAMDVNLVNFFKDQKDARATSNSKAIVQSLEPTLSLAYHSKAIELSSDDDSDVRAQNVSQLSLFYRKKFDEDLYAKLHYFKRLYDNPLYGLKHRLSMQLPTLNLWGNVALNYYQQKSGYLFKNLHLNAQITKRDIINESWQLNYTLGLNKYFLDYSNPTAQALDPLVYSRYRKNHQFGGYFITHLFYTPYDDLKYNMRLKFSSNEALNIIDHISLKLQLNHLINPFELSLYYDGRYYFEDRHRPYDYSINRIGADLSYYRFFGNNWLELELGALYKIENRDAQIFFGLTWHFSGNKIYHNFTPYEQSFIDLKMLHEDEKGAW